MNIFVALSKLSTIPCVDLSFVQSHWKKDMKYKSSSFLEPFTEQINRVRITGPVGSYIYLAPRDDVGHDQTGVTPRLQAPMQPFLLA